MKERSDGLHDRLRRLRREPRAKHAPADELPIWLKKKLAAGDSGSGRSAEGTRPALESRERAVGAPKRLVEGDGPLGPFSARCDAYADQYRHGDWRLSEVDHVDGDELAFFGRDERLARISLRRCVYLDIETTGLSGGAGTVPFLVALGSFEEESFGAASFRLWQGFVREPAEEAAVLAEVARRVADAEGVVSFFGKSFDRHRLEDKMRVYGIDAPFADLPHLDLYHPLVRLYRGAFDNGRLGTFERELCGVQRTDDLPGSFAPEAWFDFLASRAHLLEQVFQHNADDVLSLVTLTASLGRTHLEERFDGGPLLGPAPARACGLARAYSEGKRRAAGLEWTERAIERLELHGSARTRAWRLLQADLLRLLREDERALACYQALVAEASDELALRALTEMSKLAEHRLADLEGALRSAERGLALAETLAGAAAGRASALRAQVQQLQHRRARLELKLAKRQARSRARRERSSVGGPASESAPAPD